MSGKLTNNVYYRILRETTRVPPPISASKQHLQHVQAMGTTPKVGRASIPAMAGVVRPACPAGRPKIDLADPAELIKMAEAAQITPPTTPETPKTKNHAIVSFAKRHPGLTKAAAAAGALLVTGLTPQLAHAGPLSQVVGAMTNLGWSGLIGASLGILSLLTLRWIYTSGVRPGASSVRRLITRFFGPLCGIFTLGGLMLYGTSILTPSLAPHIAPLLGISPDSINSNTPFLLLAGAGLAYTLIRWGISAVKGIYNRRIPWVKDTRGDYGVFERILTEFFARGTKFALALYYGYLHTQTAALLVGISGKAVFGFATGLINPPAIIFGAGLGLLYSLIFTRPDRKEFNGLDYPGRPGFSSKSVLSKILLGATVGALAGVTGWPLLINTAVAFIFLGLTDHAFPHSWRLQDSALDVESAIPNVHSDQTINRVARDRLAHSINMIKVSRNARNVLVSLFMGLFIRKGANWTVSQIDQAGYGDGEMQQALQTIRNLATTLRAEISTEYNKAKDTTTPAEALEILASYYENLGQRYIDEYCHGNLGGAGVAGCTNNMFDSNDPDCELVHLGKIIRTEGHIFLEKAAHYRALAKDSREGRAIISDEGLRTRVLHEFDKLHRKFWPHLMFIPIFDWANTAPFSPIQKIEATDEFYHMVRDWRTATLVVTRGADGILRRELIPMRTVKELDPGYRDPDRIAIESKPKMDNRFGWRVREALEVEAFDHFSNIAYIDDKDLFEKHGDDPNYYPTGDISKSPVLRGTPRKKPAANGSAAEAGPRRFKNADINLGAAGVKKPKKLLLQYNEILEQPADDPESLQFKPSVTRAQVEATHNSELLRLFDASGAAPAAVSKEEGEPDHYDVVYKDGSIRRVYADGSTKIVKKSRDGQDPPDNIAWIPGTTAVCDLGGFESLKTLDVSQKIFFYPIDFFTLSDEEQIDLIVSDLLANLLADMAQPQLYIQSMIPEKITAPFEAQMKDSPHDTFLKDIAPVTSWFLTRVTEKPSAHHPQGRTLWIPYNLVKEEVDGLWQEIDTNAPAEIIPTGREAEYTLRVTLNADILSKRYVARANFSSFSGFEAKPGHLWAALIRAGCIDTSGIRQPNWERNLRKGLRRYINLPLKKQTELHGILEAAPTGIPPSVGIQAKCRPDGSVKSVASPGAPYVAQLRDDGRVIVDLPRPHLLYFIDTLGELEKVQFVPAKDKEGPQPCVKFPLLRRNAKGEIVRRVKNGSGGYVEVPMSTAEWDTWVKHPIPHEAVKQLRTDKYKGWPYSDQNGKVHIPDPDGSGTEEVIEAHEYMTKRQKMLDETTYERFMPTGDFIKFWLRGTVE